MDTKELIAVLIFISIFIIYLYIWWKHPKYINAFKWAFLISMTLFFVTAIWAQDIPNSFLLGLLCAPPLFIFGYLRFFWKEKFAKSLINDLQAVLPNEQKKVSRDIRNNPDTGSLDDGHNSK